MNSNKTDRSECEDVDPQWRRVVAERSDDTVISQYCPDRPYLELEVPAEIKHVRRIQWTTVSHDQGFSGEDRRHHGTYEQSYTWFDAAVIAPNGHDRIDRPRLQFNRHAVREAKKHINIWDSRTGSDEVKRFLKCIKEGDRICIIPKARHVAWKNYVLEAEIQLFGEEDDASLQLAERVGELNTDDSPAIHDTIYRSLKKSSEEIRLIILAPGQTDDPVVCELEYVTFEKSHVPSYEALSYCWGDSTDRRIVRVSNLAHVEGARNDAEMQVTFSLYEALRCMRYTDRPRTIWADAVCINQRDLDERSQQVGLMPTIYTEATGIIVWLGPSTKEILQTFEDLARIQELYEQAGGDSKDYEVLKKLHGPPFAESPLLIDSPLFEYEYFRRTWVLQEVYNARNVTVLCGTQVINWAPILRLNQCLVRSMLIPNAVGKHILPSLFAGLFEVPTIDAKNPSLKYKKQPSKLDILDVVLRGLDLEASDPRDKLFALLAFGKETSVFENLPMQLEPDYKKDQSFVFADFTRWWISTHKSLRILSAVHTGAGRTWQPLTNSPLSLDRLDHPSWSWWPTGKSFWVRGTLGLSSEFAYNASLGTVPDEELLNNPADRLTLSLVGYRVTKIISIEYYKFAQIAPYLDTVGDKPDPWKEIHQAYCHLFDPIEEWGTWRYGVTHQTPEVMALRRRNTPDEIERKLDDHLYTHMECATNTGGIECHGQTFFRTEDGQMGLCPPEAQEGDDIVVLYGGQVPYVLRPRARKQNDQTDTTKYTFVGECFLDGYMQGLCIGENTDGEELNAPEVFHFV